MTRAERWKCQVGLGVDVSLRLTYLARDQLLGDRVHSVRTRRLIGIVGVVTELKGRRGQSQGRRCKRCMRSMRRRLVVTVVLITELKNRCGQSQSRSRRKRKDESEGQSRERGHFEGGLGRLAVVHGLGGQHGEDEGR